MSGVPAHHAYNGGGEPILPPGPIALAKQRAANFSTPSQIVTATAEIEEAEATAKTLARNQEVELRTKADHLGADVFERLAAVRDDAKALVAEVQAGRISIEGALVKLAALENGITASRQTVTHYDRLHASADDIAADPVAHGDQAFRKYPTAAPNFSF